MKTKILTIGLLFVALSSFASDNHPPKDFTDLLERAGMMFQMPQGLIECATIENRQMNYEFALKHQNKKFEVRYAIRPLSQLIRDYKEKEKSKKPGEIVINPNTFYNSLFQATVLNISGGVLPKFSIFDKASVKNDFNADWGATTFVKVGKEFGQEYNYCMVVTIHKDDLGDAYIFYMADNIDVAIELAESAFFSLKFK